jgi:hypothetical protein
LKNLRPLSNEHLKDCYLNIQKQIVPNDSAKLLVKFEEKDLTKLYNNEMQLKSITIVKSPSLLDSSFWLGVSLVRRGCFSFGRAANFQSLVVVLEINLEMRRKP